MAHKGTRWRQHQKLQKVLELASFDNTWEMQVLEIIHRDMKMISKSGMWPYTTYSPYPHLRSIPGDMSDISPEELRYLKYTSSEDEYVAYEKLLEEDYKYLRGRLRRDKSLGHNSGEHVCDEADELMMYLAKEVYISEDKDTTHFSRYDCVARLHRHFWKIAHLFCDFACLFVIELNHDKACIFKEEKIARFCLFFFYKIGLL